MEKSLRAGRWLAALALWSLAAPALAEPMSAKPIFIEPMSAKPILTEPVPPVARPALWVVSDRDTIIYLFGTFHAHDGRAAWFGNAVKTAFDGSDQLILETIVPGGRLALEAALARHRAKSRVAPGTGGLAGARRAVAAARSAGMRVDQGADAVLARAAATSGKPVEGLETFEFQLEMFDRLPGPPPSAAPAATLAAARAKAPDPAIADFMRGMMAAWNRGDPSTFESVVGAIEVSSPAAYRTLFADRNANWAKWISDRLKQPGTVFVAVGTGHLVGRDSVQARLAARGIASARVN